MLEVNKLYLFFLVQVTGHIQCVWWLVTGAVQVKNLVAPMYLLIFSHHSSNNAWRFSSK